MNLNKAMIIGNLTRDPELKNTPSGQNVASFTGNQQKKVEFHNVIAWRKLADICSKYLKKGSKVYIEGRLQTSDWIGNDSVKRYRTEIIADNMIMLDSKNNFSDSQQNYNSNNNKQEEEVIEIPEEPSDEEIKVENIPF